ncbi:LOW QUALITY PROTEIN: CD160 antigen-like [Dermochelys coriacea]|uniref:LOW QUALITY PROTEIN: CD160 antigen-like n=1 Tax=Dermochelys coriacea TaxID=27794 RepID=UPI0018E82D67|nr:LOW QUALITY PROTEIN: CD160 antigen-like [Dermochelys coriacea]
MVSQKMRRIRGWLIGCGRNSLIVALLWATLEIKATGCDMLEIIYPSASFILKEGDLLTLNCTVWHQQKQPSDLKVYWCKQVKNQHNCARVGKELERLLSTEHLNPQARVSLSLLLQIHNVSQSDSGVYQCRANASNETSMGHYIRANVTAEELNHVSSLNTTRSPEAVSQGSKALRMDIWLEKTWAVIMILWLTLS